MTFESLKLDIKKLAGHIDAACKEAKAVPQLSTQLSLTVAQAYQIQAESINCRLQRGEVLTGVKMGFTSRAKMQQMGVSDLIMGRLTDAMEISEGGRIDLSRFVHPRIEPEIAFRLKKDITKNRSGRINLLEVTDYIDAIAPAMEIIDSRYANFKFSLEDVLADNCSSSGYVIGQWFAVDTPIQNLGIQLSFNGHTKLVGSTAGILGNPLRSLIEASRLATQHGIPIKAGDIFLAGAATEAIALEAATTVTSEFQNLGKVSVQVQESQHQRV